MGFPFRIRRSVFFAWLALWFCPISSGQDGLQLFHKMQSALGGADKIAAIHDFEQIVRADIWDNNGKPRGIVRKRVRFIRPNCLRVDQVGPGDAYVLYFNGNSGWEILPDKTVAVLAGGELKFAEHYSWSFDLNLWLADQNPRYVISSPGPFLIDISDKNDPSQKIELTLDVKTFLPIKTTSISLADPSHPVRSETQREGWQAVEGVEFPQMIANFHDGKKLAAIVEEQILVNRGLKPDELSAKPRDLNPVMVEPTRAHAK